MLKIRPIAVGFPRCRCGFTVALFASIFLAGSLPALAASENRSVFLDSLAKMPAGVVAAAANGGKPNSEEIIEFQVALKMRDFPKLQARLAAGETISQAEMAEKYYPLDSDYRMLSDWFRAQGLSVTNIENNRLVIIVSGRLTQVESVLSTSFARVNVEGKDYTAAQFAPSLPDHVAGPVLGLNGLQPYLHARKHSVPRPLTANQPPFLVKEILHAYDADNLGVTGAGQKIAILITGPPADTDLTQFWSDNGINQTLSNIEKVDVLGTNNLPAPEGEETLDVEWSSGIAPAAKIRIYETTDLRLSDVDKGLQRIISDLPNQPQLKQLSLSLGLGETYYASSQLQTDAQLFATIASFGVSTFVSSGDAGSNPDSTGHAPPGPLQTEYASCDPSVTGVGGTSLFLNGATGNVDFESGWSDGGGGISQFFARPAYQTGPGVPAGDKRLVPDVSLAADPQTGAYVVLGGKVTGIGGTSWSAPAWAGFCALLNQARVNNNQPSLGLLNPHVYPLLGTANFRDITSGNNGAYSAGAGYDLVTGVGVPNMRNLLQTLKGPVGGASLTITNFAPTSGAPGASVVIHGTQFNHVNGVQFHGTNATFTLNSSTQITAVVPASATTGKITVFDTTGGQATSAASFVVIASGASNNNFANGEVLSGSSGKVTGSNSGANREAGEPQIAGNPGGASVWYKWVAPSTGIFTFDTTGSSFDTLLAVYTGNSVGSLVEVASDDDSGTVTTSSVTFHATAGTTYHIVVDGYAGAKGNIVLNFAPNSAAPVITDFTPDRGGPGIKVVISGANFVGVSSVKFAGTSASFTINSPKQITATVPANATTGAISVSNPNGVTTSTAFFTFVSAPPNDNFEHAQQLGGTSGAVSGTNVGATREVGEPKIAGNAGGASVWYAWKAPATAAVTFDTNGSSFDTLLSVYTGNSLTGLTLISSDDDANHRTATSTVTFAAHAGITYRIAVDGYNGATGQIALNFATSTVPPKVTGFEPTSGGAGIRVTITGSNFLGTTAVQFHGTNAPFVVDDPSQITAIVPTGATNGPISVQTFNGVSSSALSFSVLPAPSNDNFAAAQTIPSSTVTVNGTNGGATKQSGEPEHAGVRGGRSVWYNWTAPSTGTYVITTVGSTFDTALAVYTGVGLTSLHESASNDDDPAGGLTSSVTMDVVAGTVYHIAVDGVNGAAGSITLSILNGGSFSNLYFTAFEASEGYNPAPLAGQKNWLESGVGGNGVGTYIPGLGQQAFLGFSPPNNGGNSLLYRPINFTPTPAKPIITFSTLMKVVDSTNNQYDAFAWYVYNTNGVPLFGIIFDNNLLSISYALDDNIGPRFTNFGFADNSLYNLEIAMDYAHNTWGAAIGGQTIISGQPITTQSAKRDLGTIGAAWLLENAPAAGDNYLLFDNYQIAALGNPAPTIIRQPVGQTVISGDDAAFYVIAAGAPPLNYQWKFKGQPITGATAPSFGVTAAQAADAGSYTVTVTNSAGSVTSSAAVLTVHPAPTAILTVQANPTNGGTVTGGGTFAIGSSHTITAAPKPGFAFSGWSDGGTANPRTVVVPSGGVTYTAEFTVLKAQLLNIATRLQVLSGDNALIGGFILTGTQPKKVIIRGIGPSLTKFGIGGALPDPTLELHDHTGKVIAFNDNWKASQADAIRATGIPPTNDFESAIVVTLPANNASYTAVLRDKKNTTGVASVEAYDLDQGADSKLANISTRGFVGANEDVMIGGVIVGPDNGGSCNVLVRAIGPSLKDFGITNALQDPTLELHDSNGHTIASNDNWQATQKAAIEATTLAPKNLREAAIVRTLKPGGYTAIVRGKGNTVGVAVVEVYNLP